MSSPSETRYWIEALHNQSVEYEKLLRVILRLSQDQDKDAVIDAFRAVLGETPVENDHYVLFGNLALTFDGNSRLIDLFRAAAGTTKRADVVVESRSERLIGPER